MGADDPPKGICRIEPGLRDGTLRNQLHDIASIPYPEETQARCRLSRILPFSRDRASGIGHVADGAYGTRLGAKSCDYPDRPDSRNVFFAIGDVHGDYARLLVLHVARADRTEAEAAPGRCVDRGNSTVLVQTGDLIDLKGPHSVDVIRLLAALRASAKLEGGQVVITMGNHGAEFLGGPNEDKAKDFIADLKRNRYWTCLPLLRCQTDVGRFLCGLPFGAAASRATGSSRMAAIQREGH